MKNGVPEDRSLPICCTIPEWQFRWPIMDTSRRMYKPVREEVSVNPLSPGARFFPDPAVGYEYQMYYDYWQRFFAQPYIRRDADYATRHPGT